MVELSGTAAQLAGGSRAASAGCGLTGLLVSCDAGLGGWLDGPGVGGSGGAAVSEGSLGVADDEGLTRAKAYVVLKAGAAASEDELKAFVKERLAPYKYPRRIEFLAELPKTATGKIQRFKLRELEGAAPRSK